MTDTTDKTSMTAGASRSASASPSARSESAPGLILPFAGLGVWNLYFLAKFALATAGRLELSILWNALLLAALLVPMKGRALRILRGCVLAVAAFLLAWSESWLPGWESIRGNAGGIAGFSPAYVLELALDFINWEMVGWAALGCLLYWLLKDAVRVTAVTLAWFAGIVAAPLAGLLSTPAEAPAEAAAAEAQTAGAQDAKTVAEWYDAFLAYEKERRAELPAGIPEKDTPFDVLLLNICSLSNDDLAAAKLDHHPTLDRFNIRFDRFNSATSYSGPAALRLLTGACGQPSHEELYGGRRTECETMNRLSALGFGQHLMMDHAGEYDDFLQTLRDRTGLAAPLESKGAAIPVRYMGFDDEEISDTLGLLRFWQRRTARTARSKEVRSVTFMNLIALHDGNRLPRHGRSEDFKPRAQRLLDDLGVFMRELDRSGRRVMLVVVPEHGAAVRGDRIQGPRLRDIPTPSVTQVPVMVKFFGVKGLSTAPLHVAAPSSYLAVTSLIGRTISTNYFGKRGGSVPLTELVRDLPETNLVSENGQAKVTVLKGTEYLRRGDGDWKVMTR